MSVAAACCCVEARWGIAITLDMWYLLTTPLSKGATNMLIVIIVVVNIILCFADTLTLVMLLAAKNREETTDEPVEMESDLRPIPRKLGAADEEVGLGATCVICLSDFAIEEEVVQLPCSHTFHSECIGKWLARSRHCPLRCPQVAWPQQRA
mmetsp:Transcript_107709/g.311170  ORF Transcript_107709/g.311170 Transcript_107709/m.311170 type:complete len:152 (+) Transcript_107709:467-922(+)